MRSLTLLLAALFCASPALAAPRIIASVVPIHAIVSAVMGDLGKPELLLSGSMSEHRASFTASQIASLGRADLVFIGGHGLEPKLAQISGSESVEGKVFVALSEALGVKTLPVREGGVWEAHNDDVHAGENHAGDDHVPGFDPHVWLDPENAKAMAFATAAELASVDPENTAAYAANARSFAASVDSTSAAITAELAAVRNKSFVVFHDAYQYFEKRFGLSAAGSITDISAQAPSAERLAQIRNRLAAAKAVCVFREPQYDSKIVNTVIEGSSAHEGVLDPLGANLTLGPEAYQQLLRNLASSFRTCLTG
jgi:zinc transport system substrate-binding protein